MTIHRGISLTTRYMVMGAPYDIDDTIRLGAPYDIDARVRLGAPYDIDAMVRLSAPYDIVYRLFL